MDPCALHGREILRMGNCDPDDRVSIERLTAGLGMSVETDVTAFGGHANAGVAGHAGRLVLWTKPGLQVVRRRELQMRVIAEWFLRREGARVSTAKRLAPSVAAYLMAPSAAMASVWASTEGRPILDRIVHASLAFAAPSACVTLRVGEVTSRPAAVVTPKRIIRRGSPELDETELRDIADDGIPESGFLCATSPDRHTHTIIVKSC
ncbi:hypothetical protein [Sorangium sp. So ce1024]|uniref:hypothetical protein n=1 Tax=Sorangium sp. So ce1024 TaxID=3133327 RepID=UPI003F05F8D0